MKRSRRAGIAGFFLLVPMIVACGGDASTDDLAGAEPTTTAETSDFPVTVGELTLDAEPARIVSMSASATETLFAIGAGEKIVAVDNFSNHPAQANELKKLDAYQPSVEAISGLEPDLVIISYDPGNLVEQLSSLDIPVFMAGAVPDLEAAYLQIEQLGALTGRLPEALQLLGTMRAEIEALVAGAAVMDPPLSYFYELDPTPYTVTSNTFIGGVMSLFGLSNIADGVEPGNDYPQLSAEIVVEKDPDIVFLADTKCCAQSLETVAARDGWGGLSAVRSGNVVELDDDVASRWGPRLVELVRVVATAIAAVATASP